MASEEQIPQDEPVEENASPAVEVAEIGEETAALQKDLESWRARAGEYLDGWQRSRAEFANYKKRLEREQAQTYQNASADILKRFLDVADDLDRALKNRPQDDNGAAWAHGIELIYRKLVSYLETSGVVLIQTEGQFFDPNLHEAITHEENDGYESGQVIEVVKQGYMMGERVLRPALVRVAK